MCTMHGQIWTVFIIRTYFILRYQIHLKFCHICCPNMTWFENDQVRIRAVLFILNMKSVTFMIREYYYGYHHILIIS